MRLRRCAVPRLLLAVRSRQSVRKAGLPLVVFIRTLGHREPIGLVRPIPRAPQDALRRRVFSWLAPETRASLLFCAPTRGLCVPAQGTSIPGVLSPVSPSCSSAQRHSEQLPGMEPSTSPSPATRCHVSLGCDGNPKIIRPCALPGPAWDGQPNTWAKRARCARSPAPRGPAGLAHPNPSLQKGKPITPWRQMRAGRRQGLAPCQGTRPGNPYSFLALLYAKTTANKITPASTPL